MRGINISLKDSLIDPPHDLFMREALRLAEKASAAIGKTD